MTATPKFSVAIPAYNEADYLPRLLDSIDAARERYAGGRDAIEAIVGNNASTDATPAIARDRGCVVADVEKRVIAAARNGAAAVARGAILCFVDADTVVHPETFNAIERTMRTGKCVVGATGARMERMSFGIGVVWLLLVPMTRLLGMDTGVVFCRREDFAAVGGYREELSYAEDVEFLYRLKRLGRGRGQRFVRPTGAPAIVSTRKFDQHGDWHFFTRFGRLPFQFLFARTRFQKSMHDYFYEARNK